MSSTASLEQALRYMSSGVYIVTSAYRNIPAGCTCVWVARASFEPLLVAVNMEPACHTIKTIEAGRRLCVNVLSADSLALARRFGFTSGYKVKKFKDVAYHKGASGSPMLDQAVCCLDCRLHSIVPAGDHCIVLGEVIFAAIQSDKPPLVYDPSAFYQPGLPETATKAGHSNG